VDRVIVGGISGAGKTTLARLLSQRLDLPYVDFDALFHGPGWTERPTFRDDVQAFVTGDRWITDSDGYAVVRDIVWDRADTLVWLDYSRARVMSRVIRRTVARIVLRQRLFNDNRERFLAPFVDAEHPVRWAWTQHGKRRSTNLRRIADPRWRELSVVRLRSPREAQEWLTRLSDL
jgi:adenylate kinase family enzyme